MTPASAEAFAPATVANLGVGFDIVGLAVGGGLGDVVRAMRVAGPPGQVTIQAIDGDGGALPQDAVRNTAGVAAQTALALAGADFAVALSIRKGLPLGSGLGSSAASAVAAVVAVSALCDDALSAGAQLLAALDGEAVAAGGYHADNVAPALWGSVTLLDVGDSARPAFLAEDATAAHSYVRQLPVPGGLWLALVTPDVRVPTVAARAALPPTVPLKTMVRQTAGVAALVDALHRHDVAALGRAIERDTVVEPARAHLMPRLAEARAAAHAAGAHGLCISGAGPTLCAVCDSQPTAEVVAAALVAVYAEGGLAARSHVGQVGGGATLL